MADTTVKKLSVPELIALSLNLREDSIKAMTRQLAKDREYLLDRPFKRLTYRVELRSSWEDHGEKSVKEEHRLPLSRVVELALKRFKELNNTDTVNVKWFISIVFPTGSTVALPTAEWEAKSKVMK